jgi:hypothetical protein
LVRRKKRWGHTIFGMGFPLDYPIDLRSAAHDKSFLSCCAITTTYEGYFRGHFCVVPVLVRLGLDDEDVRTSMADERIIMVEIA